MAAEEDQERRENIVRQEEGDGFFTADRVEDALEVSSLLIV